MSNSAEKITQHAEHYHITKTYLYNVDPLKPHFYIVKLGFTGVYIISLFLLKNVDCGYSLEPPRRGGSNEYHNLCFEQKYEKKKKTTEFVSENVQFLVVKLSIYLNRRVFVMKITVWLERNSYLISRMDEPMAKDGLWSGVRNKSQWKYDGSFMAQVVTITTALKDKLHKWTILIHQNKLINLANLLTYSFL